MAIEYYMNIPGVVGETTSAAHLNQIALASLTFGSYTNTDSSGLPTGSPIPRIVSITLPLNLSSMSLGQLLNDRTVIPSLTLFAYSPDGTVTGDILTIKLVNALVEAQSIYGLEGGSRVPTESISLSYSAIEVTYKKKTATAFVNGGSYLFPPKT
ncbi:MAG TPA: type VI secretion system tube protein Hcp [Fimbriimonas sp.]|nr:type VI secretion system tube protein Hcp [Fimbriimonas sp.]